MVGAEGIGYRRSWRRACRHDLLDCQVRVLNHRVAMCPKSTPQHITAVRHSGPLLTARTKPNGMISGSFSVRPLRRRACLPSVRGLFRRYHVCSAAIWIGSRIASPEMFPEAEMLPHLICSRPMFIGGANDEADQHGGA
jgi:hypothetical protein